MGEDPRAFVGSMRRGADVVEAAAAIGNHLGFELEIRRRSLTWTDALRKLLELAERAGVLVMVNAVVGSNYNRKLDPAEFRGFALADTLAPLVFVNGSDTKAAQMFTLAHELVHIWIGATALTNADLATPPKHPTERWCREVATELLARVASMPEDDQRSVEPRDAQLPDSRRFARALIADTLEGNTSYRDAFHMLGISRESSFRELSAQLGYPT